MDDIPKPCLVNGSQNSTDQEKDETKEITERLDKINIKEGVDSDLLSNKDYFFVWMNEIGVQISSVAQIAKAGDSLFDNIGGFPIGEEELESYIKNYDQVDSDEEKTGEEDVAKTKSKLKPKFPMYPLQQTAAVCVEAFYEISVQDDDTARETIKAIEIYLKRCKRYLPSEEYLVGFYYFMDLLKAHFASSFPQQNGFSDSNGMIQECEMSDLAKSAVQLIKFTFVSNITRLMGYNYSHYQLDALKKVLFLVCLYATFCTYIRIFVFLYILCNAISRCGNFCRNLLYHYYSLTIIAD